MPSKGRPLTVFNLKKKTEKEKKTTKNKQTKKKKKENKLKYLGVSLGIDKFRSLTLNTKTRLGVENELSRDVEGSNQWTNLTNIEILNKLLGPLKEVLSLGDLCTQTN